MTRKEMLAWLKRISDNRVSPSRSDYYAAQIAKEVHDLPYRQNGIKPTLTLNDFILRTEKDKKEAAKKSVTNLANIAKAVWASRVKGANVKINNPPKE